MKQFGWAVCMCWIIWGGSACTTVRSIEPPFQAVKGNFETGEVIKVYTRENTVITLEVVEITADGIVGAREQIPFKEIRKIETQEFKELKPTAAGGIVALGIFVAGMVGWMVLF